MPLTKQYLRYETDGIFNIIASNACNVTFLLYNGESGRYVAVGAADDVVIWDLRLNEKSCVFHGEQIAVTYLVTNLDGQYLAAGYMNGTIKIYDLHSNTLLCTLAGHDSPISCLAFHDDGQSLGSGSEDSDVIVWDVVAQRGKLRLCGHTNSITQVCFMKTRDVLISSSKDTYVKFWDLKTGHCFETLAAYSSPVWSIALRCEDKFLVTATDDVEVGLWQLMSLQDQGYPIFPTQSKIESMLSPDAAPAIDNNAMLTCRKMGSLLRSTLGRCIIQASENSGHIALYTGKSNTIDILYFNSEKETKKRAEKRFLKSRNTPGSHPMPDACNVTDRVTRCSSLKTNERVKSCHLTASRNGELRLAVLFHCNKLELYSMMDFKTEVQLLQSVHKMGHRGDISSVCLSSDNLAVVTGGSDAVKIWNRLSRTCIRSICTGNVKSLCLTPGDRHLLVGLEKKLVVMDLTTSDILEEIAAHDNEIWSISMYPNQSGCVTGSSDKTVKFWDFTLIEPKKPFKTNARVLSLLHTRTLNLEESVVCTCISPNSHHIAVSLINNTVKILFFDSLKHFHTLYGHSLPVTCLDISYDSTIICTGSADRNIKIWGMDFGDCHKSIVAHERTITCLKFIPKTHYFFSCGGDGLIKQWDADSFEQIQTLKGHTGSVLGMAVTDKYVVSSGVDRVVRLWKCTSEPLVLEDERQEERAQEEEMELATGTETIVPGQASHSLPSRKTVGAEKAAEELMEALDLATEYKETLQEYQVLKALGKADKIPNPPLLMASMGITDPDEFLFAMMNKIRKSDLEEALLLLRFSNIEQILKIFPHLLDTYPFKETVITVYSFLLKVYGDMILSCPSLLPIMQKVQELSGVDIKKKRDIIGETVYSLGSTSEQTDAPSVEEEVLHIT